MGESQRTTGALEHETEHETEQDQEQEQSHGVDEVERRGAAPAGHCAEEVSRCKVLSLGEVHKDVCVVPEQERAGRGAPSQVAVQEGGEEEEEGERLLEQEAAGQGEQGGAGGLAAGAAERAQREGERLVPPHHRGLGPEHQRHQADTAEHDELHGGHYEADAALARPGEHPAREQLSAREQVERSVDYSNEEEEARNDARGRGREKERERERDTDKARTLTFKAASCSVLFSLLFLARPFLVCCSAFLYTPQLPSSLFVRYLFVEWASCFDSRTLHERHAPLPVTKNQATMLKLK